MISDKLYEFLELSSLESVGITELELRTEFEKFGFAVEDAGKDYKIKHNLHTKISIYIPKTMQLWFLSIVVANKKIVWTSLSMSDDEKRSITLPKDDFVVIQKPYLNIHSFTFFVDKFFEKYQEVVNLPEPLKIISLKDLFNNMANDIEDEMIMFESEFNTIKERMDSI